MALWVSRAERTGVSVRFRGSAASGITAQVNASTFPTKMANAVMISIFNQKCLSRRATVRPHPRQKRGIGYLKMSGR